MSYLILTYKNSIDGRLADRGQTTFETRLVSCKMYGSVKREI
jgi:hypothetical protein